MTEGNIDEDLGRVQPVNPQDGRARLPALPPVLYEDDGLIAFDKPAGLLTAPDRWNRAAPNLIRMAQYRLGAGIFNVHRLDRETSGVLLCGRTPNAVRKMSAAFAERRVEKRYLALVRGAPPWDQQELDVALESDPVRRGHMRVARRGLSAVTRFAVIERWHEAALIEARPLTGRLHQVRVHLAHAGFPLIADGRYGNRRGLMLSELKRRYKHKAEPERPLIGRAALHAETLRFDHPITNAAMDIRAPSPHDFEIAIKYLRRFGRGA